MSTPPAPPCHPHPVKNLTQTLKRTHSCRCSRSPPAGSAPTGASSFWHNDATRGGNRRWHSRRLPAARWHGTDGGCRRRCLGEQPDDGPGMHGRMNGNGRGQGQGPNGGRKGRMGQDGQGGQGGLGGMRGGLEGFLGIQHGDVVITGPNGQPETKRVARGAITAVTATALTVKSADGFDSTFTVTPTTAVRRGNASSVSALAVGQNVLAVGSVAGTTADR